MIVDLKEEIQLLKRQTSTIILAHYYQVVDVQDVGDFLGDSLDLSRKAMHVQDVSNIIFAAVDFMAEVAKILNPSRHILIPDTTATCPMANQLKAAQVRDYKARYPGIPVVLYINTLAEAKAEADTICTSANAVQVCKAITRERGVDTVLMGPDKHLSYHVRKQSGIDVITMPETGCCIVHDQFTVEDVNCHRKLHPDAKIIVHPECPPGVQDIVDFVGSTSQMIQFVRDNHSSIKSFVIGTEQGMIDHLARQLPGISLHSLSPVATGLVCRNMKKTTLEKVHELLVKIKQGNADRHVINVDPVVEKRAKDSIDKMFALTGG